MLGINLQVYLYSRAKKGSCIFVYGFDSLCMHVYIICTYTHICFVSNSVETSCQFTSSFNPFNDANICKQLCCVTLFGNRKKNNSYEFYKNNVFKLLKNLFLRGKIFHVYEHNKLYTIAFLYQWIIKTIWLAPSFITYGRRKILHVCMYVYNKHDESFINLRKFTLLF